MTTTKKSATPLRWAGLSLSALLAVMVHAPVSASPVGLDAQSPAQAWQAPAIEVQQAAELTTNFPFLTGYDPITDTRDFCACYVNVVFDPPPIFVVLEPNAVPEPSSLALLGLGVAGIAALHRRRA